MTMPTFEGVQDIDLKKYGQVYKLKENNRHLDLLREIARSLPSGDDFG